MLFILSLVGIYMGQFRISQIWRRPKNHVEFEMPTKKVKLSNLTQEIRQTQNKTPSLEVKSRAQGA